MSVSEPKLYKDVLKDLGESTSCHGIPKVISSRQLAVKVLWCLLLLGAVVLFVIQFKGLYEEYISYPIKTSVSLKFSSLQLPAITLCNMNPAKISLIHNYQKLHESLGLAETSGSERVERDAHTTTTSSPQQATTEENDFWDTWANFGTNSTTYNEFGELVTVKKDKYEMWRNLVLMEYKILATEEKKKIGHQYEHLVSHATFAGIEVTEFPYKEVQTTEYGNCFTINHSYMKAKATGPFEGIKFILNLEIDEYVQQFSSGYGIRMVIHDQGTTPLPEREGITLNPNFETNVGLKMISLNRVDGNYGDCTSDKYFERYKNISYTVPFCYAICESKYIMETCGCISRNTPDILDMGGRICNVNLDSDNWCIMDIMNGIENGDIDCKCTSRCKERVFEKTVSGRKWPHEKYMQKVLMKETCEQNLTSMQYLCAEFKENDKVPDRAYQNFLSVNVYYEDLNYEVITEEPSYPFIRFLSDIGGAMGLYIGASVLTYLELFQLALETFLYLWYERKRRNDVGQISEKESK